MSIIVKNIKEPNTRFIQNNNIINDDSLKYVKTSNALIQNKNIENNDWIKFLTIGVWILVLVALFFTFIISYCILSIIIKKIKKKKKIKRNFFLN